MTTTAGTGVGSAAGPWALERRYRYLLRAYPRDYRERFGEEIVATLLETTPPARSVPSPREAASLVHGGLRARAALASEGPPWRDGLHLGVLVVALGTFATLLPYAGSIPLWVGLSAATVFAVTYGWVWPAIPLAAVTGGKVAAMALGRPWLDQTLLPVLPDRFWGGRALYGTGGPIAPMIAYAVLIVGLLVLASSKRPLRTRSWRWWAVAPLVAGADPAWLDLADASPATFARVAVEAGLLLLACWAGHVSGDPRWAVAAGVYLVTQLAVPMENLSLLSRNGLAHWALLALLTVAATVAPYQSRRRLQL
ncbi:hypothetical protein [Microbispora sp. NPDC049125]|uniref:hypothetical protein n=1 Tax=Microbispora sp. NPDC049125 TaxID=3154929 RepID=UPI003467D496